MCCDDNVVTFMKIVRTEIIDLTVLLLTITSSEPSRFLQSVDAEFLSEKASDNYITSATYRINVTRYFDNRFGLDVFFFLKCR